MYHSESRIVRIITVGASLAGLVASLITIYAYFSTDGSPLAWVGAERFDQLAIWASSFAERWPLGPLLTALLAYGMVAAIVFASDRWEDPVEYVGMLMLLFPLPGAWIWLFSDAVSGWTLTAFVVGYAAVPWLTVFAPIASVFAVEDWLERRRVLVGAIRSVNVESRLLFKAQDYFVYTMVLERDGDLPVRVTFHTWRRRDVPPGRGTRVRVFGRWREGDFIASRFEVLADADGGATVDRGRPRPPYTARNRPAEQQP